MNFLLKKNRLTGLFSEQRCEKCDTNLQFEFDYLKKEFTVADSLEDCPCTEHKIKFSLEVPEQELVFINDIRHIFRVKRKDEYKHSINSIYGKILECEEYLKHNIAYISLGSGSVEILHSEKEKMFVLDFYEGNYYKPIDKDEGEWGEDEEEDWDDYPDRTPIDGFHKEGRVDLDLWGVFIMSKKTYEKICKEAGYSLNWDGVETVKIKGDRVEVDYDLHEYLVKIKYY